MFRFRLCLLTIYCVFAAVLPTAGVAQDATPTPPAPPPQPTAGPGGSEALFDGMTSIEQRSEGGYLADYWLFIPSEPLPGTPADEPLPIVLFLHGSGAINAAAYMAWVEHLVVRGAVVIFPLYESWTGVGDLFLEYQQNLLNDVRNGLARLEQEDIPFDLTRVAVVGHSLGGDQALVYAASAASAGLPVPSAVMSIVPGGCRSAEGECLGVDLGVIPATTRLLLVGGMDDPGGMIGFARIWAELSSVPLDNRDVVTLVTDSHGTPRLLAGHFQALADNRNSLPNAFDWYGTWKWLDALMSCSFDGEWCEYALGNTPEQRLMGTWSDGTPVVEPIVTDEPRV
jgi:hypothetical protein